MNKLQCSLTCLFSLKKPFVLNQYSGVEMSTQFLGFQELTPKVLLSNSSISCKHAKQRLKVYMIVKWEGANRLKAALAIDAKNAFVTSMDQHQRINVMCE